MSTATPLRLDTTVCDRCGRCASACKPKALTIGPGYILVDWDRCDACGKCADVCDREAIVARGAAALASGARAADLAGGEMAVAKPAAKPAPKSPAKASAKPGAVPAPKPMKGAAVPAPADAPAQVRESVTRSGVAWSLPEAALVFLVALALLVGAQALLGGVMSTPVWGGVELLAYDALLAALLVFLARRHGANVLSALRLDVVPEWRYAALAVPVSLGCWLFSVTYRATALAIGITPPVSEGGTDLTALFGSGAVGIALTVAVVAVLGPLLEEALLRGVVLTALRRRIGDWPAVLAGALAFALLHANLWSLLPLTVLGVGLGWLATRSRSLWPAVVAHVLYNGVLVGAALYAAAR